MGGEEFQQKQRKLTKESDSGQNNMSGIDKISTVEMDGQERRNGGIAGETVSTVRIERQSIPSPGNDGPDQVEPKKLQDTLQYKFIQSFVKGCQKEFDNLSHQSMESKLATTALSSTVTLLCLPCGPCKSAGKPLIKPTEAFCKHLDRNWQTNRQLWWRHQTDSFKPSTSEKFYRLFIQSGLEVFHVYESQIRGLYRQLSPRQSQTAKQSCSGSQALIIFAEFTARLVFQGFTDTDKAILPEDDILSQSLTKLNLQVKHLERRFWYKPTHKLRWDSKWDNSDSDSDSKSKSKAELSCPAKIDIVDLLTLPIPAFSKAHLTSSTVVEEAPANQNV